MKFSNNAYIRSLQEQAIKDVDHIIEIATEFVPTASREEIIASAKKATKETYSHCRITLNGFSQYDTDDRVSKMRTDCVIAYWSMKYAEEL